MQLVGVGHAADADLQEIVKVTGYEVAVEHLLQGEDRLLERSSVLRSWSITTPAMTSAPKPTAAGETTARTCLISFKRNRYSLPALFANRLVSLRVYPDRLVVTAERQLLCEHERLNQRSHHLPPRTIYDWRPYLAVLQRKPGALRNGAPFGGTAACVQAIAKSDAPLVRRRSEVGRYARLGPAA